MTKLRHLKTGRTPLGDDSNMEAYDQLPEHFRGGMKRYIEHGIPPGGFLRACLENDLRGAFRSADNPANMESVSMWIYLECPCSLQGSAEKVAAWIKENRK